MIRALIMAGKKELIMAGIRPETIMQEVRSSLLRESGALLHSITQASQSAGRMSHKITKPW